MYSKYITFPVSVLNICMDFNYATESKQYYCRNVPLALDRYKDSTYQCILTKSAIL